MENIGILTGRKYPHRHLWRLMPAIMALTTGMPVYAASPTDSPA